MDNNFDPDAYLAQNSGSSDAQGFDPDAYLSANADNGKSVAGFARNAVSDVGNIASGIGNLATGLVTHPVDTTTNLAKNILPATFNEYKNAITHPIEHTYAHPVNTVLDALPLASGALKVGQAAGLLGEAAEGAEAANLAKSAGLASEEATSALSPNVSEMVSGPLNEATSRASASAPTLGSSSLESVSPKDAFVKAQFDYEQNIAKFNEMQEQAYNAGKGAEFDKMAEQNPYYQAAAKSSDDLMISAKDLRNSGMTGHDIDRLRFETPKQEQPITQTSSRPTVGSIIGGSDVPVAKDFVPTNERVANSMFLQGVGGTPRQFLRAIGNSKSPMDTVSGIRNWAETADNGKSITGLLDRPGEFLEKVNDIHDKAGKTIGDILDQAGKESPTGESLGLPAVDKQKVIGELKSFAENTADMQTEGRINKLITVANKLEGKPVTDLRTLQQIKQMAGEQIAKDPEMATIYGHLADRMNGVIDEYGKAIDHPELKAAYDKAKIDYANSSKLLPMLKYAEARNLIGGPAGHATLRGMLGNMTEKISELATGHTPSQLYKNALLQGAGKVAPIAGIVSKVPKGLTTAGYAGLEDYLTNNYRRKNQ